MSTLTNPPSPLTLNKTLQPNSLHTLPSELRIKIFQSLCSNWSGLIPDIIKALRGDWVLYHEALEEFYRLNVYVFREENAWGFGDMSRRAVGSIRSAGIVVGPGIMHQGLWRVRNPDADTTYSSAIKPATLSDAPNIRELLMQFTPSPETEDILPFTAFGQVTFSLNYFITPFTHLKRVDMILPRRSISNSDYTVLLREKKLEYGIKGINSRLGAVGRLKAVKSFTDSFEGWEGESWGQGTEERRVRDLLDLRGLEEGERWFWEAGEGYYLGGRREVVEIEEELERVERVGNQMGDLEINPWR